MVDKRLSDFIKQYLQNGYSEIQLQQHLLQSGWDRYTVDDAFQSLRKPKKGFFAKTKQPSIKPITQDLGKPQHHNAVKPIVAIALLFIFLGGFFYTYFFVINPSFVKKPYVPRPSNPVVGQPIAIEHVKYLANEGGVYKLHDKPLG